MLVVQTFRRQQITIRAQWTSNREWNKYDLSQLFMQRINQSTIQLINQFHGGK